MLLNPPRPLDEIPPSNCELGDVTVAGVAGRTISVRSGAIEEIRASRPGDDGRYSGSFVTPGLIDSHQHLPPATPLKLSSLFCLLYLMHGVTSVLEAGDGDGMAVASARKLVIDGQLPGPRVVTVGPFIARLPRQWQNTVFVEDPLAADAVVQAAVDRGAQMIKLYEALTQSDIEQIVAAARLRGLRAIGHVPAALDIEDAGVPEVQHFFGVPTAESRGHAPGLLQRMADWHAVDEQRLETVVEASVAKGISHTPTLVVSEGILRARGQDPSAPLMPRMYTDVVWDPSRGIPTYRNVTERDVALLRESIPIKLELVRRLHEAGVPLYPGTDAPQPYVVAGESLQREMHLFAEAGVPAAEVMEMATARAGERLGVPGLGTLAAGAPADMLVFDADPRQDLAALDTLRAVVVGGRLFDIATLRSAVERQLRHYRSPLVDRASIVGARRALRAITVS